MDSSNLNEIIYQGKFAFFRTAEEVMINPFLPAGIPKNFHVPNLKSKSPSSRTLIDEYVRDEIKDNPHDEDLRYLRKRQLRRRQARIFSIFSLVRFKNTACTPSGTKNTYTGTCYLSTECLEKGGATGGTCAGGFGVCCYFIAECGRTYSQNLTYWSKTSTSPCNIQVCKCQTE